MSLLTFVLLAGHCFAKNEGTYKIVKGDPIPIDVAPWAVMYGQQCGGSILNSRWILTAAHCTYSGVIRYNATHRKSGELVWIDKWLPHKMYNGITKDYDFQLLQLKTEIKFDKYVKAIEIGRESQIKPGAHLTVVGWGSLEYEGSLSDKLMSITVPVQSSDLCNTMYAREGANITERMFCAGYMEGGKDSCQGDSGGPATIHKKLVGVVSWGTGCAKAGKLGVYANVPVMRKWIQETMKQNRPGVIIGSDGKECLCKPETDERRQKKKKGGKKWKTLNNERKQMEIKDAVIETLKKK